jgi:hypothetical protein
MKANQNQKRPRGITLIVVLAVIAGIWFIMAGITITLLTPATVVTTIEGMPPATTDLTPAAGIIVMALVLNFMGGAHLAIASGMIKRKKWSWSGAMILSAISIVVSLVLIVLAGNLGMAVNILIAAAIMYYLNMSKARQYFGRAEH